VHCTVHVIPVGGVVWFKTTALTIACVFAVMLAGGACSTVTVGAIAVIAIPANPRFPAGDCAIGVAVIVTLPPAGIADGALYVAV
jgi:hypothetical protein